MQSLGFSQAGNGSQRSATQKKGQQPEWETPNDETSKQQKAI
jgi:hypothetical protein